MEDTLRARFLVLVVRDKDCLNPCSNGRYSQRLSSETVLSRVSCLNPCSNGRYSQSVRNPHTGNLFFVLILVLMEDTLRVIKNKDMETIESLNPCSNGRYSQRPSLLF